MGIKLLIVDTSPTVCEALRVMFSDAGVDAIYEAAGSQAARQILQHQPVDIVLLDVLINDWEGLALLAELKACYADLPILVHSLSDRCRVRDRSMALGAAGYLLKGTANQDLVHAVRAAARPSIQRRQPTSAIRGGSAAAPAAASAP